MSDESPVPAGEQPEQSPEVEQAAEQTPADVDEQPATDSDTTDDLAQLDGAELAKMVRKLRSENASTRTNAKQQAATEAAEQARSDMAREIGKTLGIVTEDGEGEQSAPDPDALAAQLAERDQELRSMRTERAAEKAAAKHGADVEALLDSRSFAGQLDELDPQSDDFTDKLDALVKSTVESNPKFKASQVPARSSSEHAGGSGGASTFTRQQIAAMSNEEYDNNRDAIRKALAAGRIS